MPAPTTSPLPALSGPMFCDHTTCAAVGPIHPAFTGNNTRIDNMCAMATAAVQEHCGRSFIQQTGLVEFHGTPERQWKDLAFPEYQPYSIYLQEPNINPRTILVWLSYRYVFNNTTLLSIGNNTSVAYVSDMPVFDFGTQVVSTGQDCFLEPVKGNPALTKVTFTRELIYHEKSVMVKYDCGYPTSNNLVQVPQNVVLATAIHAIMLMSRMGQESLGVGGIDEKRARMRVDPRVTPPGVTQEAQYLLRPWRRSAMSAM